MNYGGSILPPVFDIQRRQFLEASGMVALGVLCGFNFAADSSPRAEPKPFDGWIRVLSTGRVILLVAKAEMGQGVITALPMLLAEELDVDWADVEVQQAPVDPSVYDHLTVGSDSIKSLWLPLRRAGAVARRQLLQAAAMRWKVPIDKCRTNRGAVFGPSGERASYAEMAQEAASLAPLPAASIELKSSMHFRLLGNSLRSVNAENKVDGSAVYGLDVRVPGMLRAVILRCPYLSGTLESFESGPALSVPGVKTVFPILPAGRDAFTRGGIAVVAQNTWAAMQGRRQLQARWSASADSKIGSHDILARLRTNVSRAGSVVTERGDPLQVLRQSARLVEATYEVPFLAHATMEPMNATVHVQTDRVEAWLPTQNAADARIAIARILGRSPKSVFVHQLLIGGGFGRRDATDFAVEAAQIAARVDKPVQLAWSREDDLQFGRYRPMAVHHLRASLDANGLPSAWVDRMSSVSIAGFLDPPESSDLMATEVGGARDIPYKVGSFRMEYTPVKCAVPVGWWRSVEDSINAFAIESFLDELAAAAQRDPVQYRLSLLREARRIPGRDGAVIETSRLARVLIEVAAQSGWDGKQRGGRSLGIACHTCRGSYIAVVVEISICSGVLTVSRVWAAVDCGFAVNPKGLESQIEGGLLFGTSAALYEAVTLTSGKVTQTNFADYRVLRMSESPLTEVKIIKSAAPPTGAGEIAVPLVAPAIANAVFGLTGHRPRRLPMRVSYGPSSEVTATCIGLSSDV